MKIRFIPFSEDVIMPRRTHDSDTGADIFMLEDGSIKSGQTLVIPSGFGVEIPNGYSARIQVRTSVAKQGIMIQGCAIDAGYTGEVHIILHNVNGLTNYFGGFNTSKFTWKKGDRLGYIEVYPTVYPEFVLEYDMRHKREKDAFGSTGI